MAARAAAPSFASLASTASAKMTRYASAMPSTLLCMSLSEVPLSRNSPPSALLPPTSNASRTTPLSKRCGASSMWSSCACRSAKVGDQRVGFGADIGTLAPNSVASMP